MFIKDDLICYSPQLPFWINGNHFRKENKMEKLKVFSDRLLSRVTCVHDCGMPSRIKCKTDSCAIPVPSLKLKLAKLILLRTNLYQSGLLKLLSCKESAVR